MLDVNYVDKSTNDRSTSGGSFYTNEQIQLIKKSVSCVDYCRERGVILTEYSHGEYRSNSPFRVDSSNPTSFLVQETIWCDYGAGDGDDAGGDIFSLVMAFERCEFSEAALILGRRIGLPDPVQVKKRDALSEKINKWHKALTDEDRNYLHSRGITDEDIARNKIGRITEGNDTGRIVVPYFENNRPVYYASRAGVGQEITPENPKYKKAYKDGTVKHVPWGLHTLDRNRKNNPSPDILCIAEGMFDALSFESRGYCVLSAITGIFPKDQLPEVIRICRQFEKVFIVYDYDPKTKSGQKFTDKMAKLLLSNNIEFIVGRLQPNNPNEKIDVSEYYQNGGSLERLITLAIPGIEFIVQSQEDVVDFERFMFEHKMQMNKTTVIRLVQDFQKYYERNRMGDLDKDYFKMLQKDILSEPSDPWVVDRVLAKHQLIYSEPTGYMEYDGTRWRYITDTTVSGYINDVLGNLARATKTNSVLKTMRPRCEIDQVSLKLNQKPVLNMLNGVLRFDGKGGFVFDQKHNPDDYCTYMLPYPYNPDASFGNWADFINSTMDGDMEAISVLQEYLGYMFFPDCRHEKALCLTGRGSNGKSIFQEAIEAMVGPENFSKVGLTDLSDKANGYSIPQLGSSLINVASETTSDATGAEDKFKMVTSGNAISARQIYKAPITIIPRAKWIVSCNDFIVSRNDKSDGWRRRWLIVDFKLSFVENPTLPHERKMNLAYKNAFKSPEELSGILNWVLIGYTRLMKQGRFTESKAVNETMKEYREIVDPITVFMQEFKMPVDGFITRKDLYSAYKEWCSENGHGQMSNGQFMRKFRRLLPEYRREIGEKGVNGVRMFYTMAIPDSENEIGGLDVTDIVDNPFMENTKQSNLFS